MIKFKPTFFPTFFTVSALIVLLYLGSWQVQRLVWKTALIEKMNHKTSLPAVELPPVVTPDMKYSKVIVKGKFLHDQEIHLFTGQQALKGSSGYNIITPVIRDNGSVILVDRGWVPADKKARENRPDTLLNDIVEIEGMVHLGEAQKRFTPDNDIEKNVWFWIDIPAIERKTGASLQGIYVRALKTSLDNSLPIAGDPVIKRRNDHLQYAITWYGLAIILLVIYVLYHMRLRREE